MDEERGLRTNEPKEKEKGYKNASLLSKIVLGLCILAFILHMVGFYSPSWSQREFVPPRGTLTVETSGLWKMCRASALHSRCYNVDSPGRTLTLLSLFSRSKMQIKR